MWVKKRPSGIYFTAREAGCPWPRGGVSWRVGGRRERRPRRRPRCLWPQEAEQVKKGPSWVYKACGPPPLRCQRGPGHAEGLARPLPTGAELSAWCPVPHPTPCQRGETHTALALSRQEA